MKHRPAVITVIAILLLINGVLTVINGYRFQAHFVVMGFGALALVLSLFLGEHDDTTEAAD